MPPEKSRPEIVQAARPLCADGRQPAMEELAAAGGVSVRTLYRLFGSRQALLRELGCRPPPTARDQVLEAALELVGRRGLAELSMDELAAAAGVSRATLYRLFPGKPALFAGLLRAYAPWEAVADAIEAMPDGPPEEVMPAIGRAIVEAMEGRVGVLLRMLFELLEGGPDVAEGMHEGMARGLPDLVEYLARQMRAGQLRPMHPVVAFQLLAGRIVVHLLTRPLAQALAGMETPVAAVVDEIVEAWLRAMAVEETESDDEPA
jgi:AcrR family transcriptional regulator